MRIERIVNSFMQSNTFILSNPGEDEVFIVDIGDFKPLMDLIGAKKVKGVFLTHAHYDHIYGINSLVEAFPECIIYGSKETLEALRNDKLNFSYYYENPLNYFGRIEEILDNGQNIQLWDGIDIQAIITPGHTSGSTCYRVNKNIFTGDAYIPNIPPVTKLKGGNKEEAKKSVKKIESLIVEGDNIHPGHLTQYKMQNGRLQSFDFINC